MIEKRHYYQQDFQQVINDIFSKALDKKLVQIYSHLQNYEDRLKDLILYGGSKIDYALAMQSAKRDAQDSEQRETAKLMCEANNRIEGLRNWLNAEAQSSAPELQTSTPTHKPLGERGTR